MGLCRIVAGEYAQTLLAEVGNCGFPLQSMLDWEPGMFIGWPLTERSALLCLVMPIPHNPQSYMEACAIGLLDCPPLWGNPMAYCP